MHTKTKVIIFISIPKNKLILPYNMHNLSDHKFKEVVFFEHDYKNRYNQINYLNGKVLVLNQNYEPLTICNVRRAVVLLYLGKAEAIYCLAEKKVTSVTRSFAYPSIVRLVFFVRVPFKKIILSRKNILGETATVVSTAAQHLILRWTM